MQHPAYQFLRRPLGGNSVNREHKRRASWTGDNRLTARPAPARSPAPGPAWRRNEAQGGVAFRTRGIRAAGHTPGNQPLVCLHSYLKELMPMATPIMAQPMISTIITITIPAVLKPTENIHLNHDRSRRSGCILASSVGTRPSPGGGTINLSPHRRQNLSSKPTAAPHSGQ